MLLATQYYRPPFPDRRRWREDLAKVRATGLQAINMWATWAWIEPEPGRFVFDDFDELVEEAGRVGLDVMITAVAELNPYWIHSEVPDSQMVDHRGHRVPSATLSYSPLGLSPGGCTDHPGVREHAGRYLEELGKRYAGAAHLRMWDCWNEIRWGVQSDAHVCFCEHTLAAYRAWLAERYGSLDALNAAWKRRHASWDEVPAGMQPNRSYVETLAFQDFLAWRTAEHTSFRAQRLRDGDPNHPIMAHTVLLSPFQTFGEGPHGQALQRGNDHELATRLDDWGVTMFPAWFHTATAETGARIECGRGAAGGGPFWVAELQGGTARNGFKAMPSVPADLQQRWVWQSYGRGAKAVVFWCWRDEVFGREAGGFGIAGDDGHAAERIAALAETAAQLREHEALLDAYAPDPAAAAVVFEPLNHQLEWAQSGFDEYVSPDSVGGYLTALERLQVPYDVIATSHLPSLDHLRVIFLPWPMIVRESAAETLAAWVEAGGTLVVETELDAFDEVGWYRYAAERPFAARLGIVGAGRRQLPGATLPFAVDGVGGSIPLGGWIEAVSGEGVEALAGGEHGAVVGRRRVGAGEVVSIGTHAGMAYRRERSRDFERFLGALLRRGDALPALRCDVADGELLQWRAGWSDGARMLFVTNGGPAVDATFSGPAGALGEAARAVDLRSGREAAVQRTAQGVALRVRLDAGGSHVLALSA